MKKIVIDKVTNNSFFKNKKNKLLGPWCLKEHLKIQDIIKNKFKYYYLEDNIDHFKAFKCCEEQHNRILKRIAEHLRFKNKIDFSLNFYKNYVSYWLFDFIHLTHYAKRLSNLYKRKYGKQKLTISINYKNLDYQFLDTQDYLQKSYKDPIFFSHFVLGFLLNLKPKKWKIENLSKLNKNISLKKKKNFFLLIKDAIKSFLFSRVNTVYGFNIFEKFFLSLLLIFKKPNIKYNKFNSFSSVININKSKLKPPLNDNELIEIALKYIPKSFYEIKNKKIKNFFLNCKNKVMLCSASSIVDDDKKFIPLLFKELGGRIVCIQHGSAYGDVSLSIGAGHEYSFDKFISWGQKDHENYKVKFLPLPSPQLRKKIEFRNIENNKKILFVSTSNFFFFPKYTKTRSFNENCNRIKNTYFFLKNIKKSIHQNIFYKDFQQNIFNKDLLHGHFSEKELLRSEFKKINFINQMPEHYISKVKLVVMNNYSTFFFKSLSMNMPTILFCKKNDWSNTKKANKYFEILHKAGIIYYNPKKAAKKVNENNFDWWYSRETQKARKLFCDEFAISDRNVFKTWIKFILG